MEMQRSINDNFKKKKSLEDALNKLRAETAREEDRLLREISEQAQYILMYSKHPEDVVVGMQLVEIRRRSDDYKKELINLMRFAIRKIEEGYLPELVKEGEVFGYWYKSGFRSGHSRIIHMNLRENYATEYAQIRLKDAVYDIGKITTTQTIAILAYLKDALKELED